MQIHTQTYTRQFILSLPPPSLPERKGGGREREDKIDGRRESV